MYRSYDVLLFDVGHYGQNAKRIFQFTVATFYKKRDKINSGRKPSITIFTPRDVVSINNDP